jgi:hypothetical protein
VDYTDLLMLLVLPFGWYLFHTVDRYKICYVVSPYCTYLLTIPVCLVFMATSPPKSYYMQPGGNIHIGKSYKLKISKEEALSKLKAKGFQVEPDTSSRHTGNRAHYYEINNAVVNGGKDTIKTIQFGFLQYGNKQLLLINNVKLKNNAQLADPAVFKRYKKFYKQMIKSGIVEELK